MTRLEVPRCARLGVAALGGVAVSARRQVWGWEGECIGVRGATSLDDAALMVLGDRDAFEDFDLEHDAFPKGWGVQVWRVPSAYFADALVERWDMGNVHLAPSFDDLPGRGYVRVVWFTVPQ